jgi:hypothetical protein
MRAWKILWGPEFDKTTRKPAPGSHPFRPPGWKIVMYIKNLMFKYRLQKIYSRNIEETQYDGE